VKGEKSVYVYLASLMGVPCPLKTAVPKLFWAGPKSEFAEHFATHASNNIW